MKFHNKIGYSNRLALYRRRKAIGRKQVARLLGHRTIDQISRFERGVKVPSLKTALKLAIIYDIPIRAMLDGYFDTCREEVRMQELSISKLRKATDKSIELKTDVCTISDSLAKEGVTGLELEKARRHSAELIRRRAEKLDHL
jgi:transcriptional regulator with XRE-family HTH domain